MFGTWPYEKFCKTTIFLVYKLLCRTSFVQKVHNWFCLDQSNSIDISWKPKNNRF